MGENGVYRHDDVRFEKTDARPGPIVGFLAGLLTVMLALMGILWWMQSREIRIERLFKKPAHPLAAARSELPEAQQRPPRPWIEGIGEPFGQAEYSLNDATLPTSAQSLRRDQEQKLANGWADPATGARHAPIDEGV